MRIEKNDCIALVIDIQEKIYPAMNAKEEFLSNSEKLIMGLLELQVPVIATQQYSKGLGQTLVEISSLIPHFKPIEKVAFSCYDEPAFVEELENTDKKTVIICGIESHVCVLQTAIDLKAAGYIPVIVTDCVTSRTKNSWKIALERFSFEGIMISSMESVLFELTRSASDPSFRTISKLVK